MRILCLLLILSVVGIATSCKNKKQEEVTTQQVEVVEITKAESVAPPQEEPKPVVKQMNYYVVAGCFRLIENAERLNAKLVNAGYDSKILPFYDMSMVTYDGYETRQEAQKALNRLVQEPENEMAWVYPVK